MTEYVIQIIGSADGSPCDIAGGYVAEFDPDGYSGRGNLRLTRDPASAIKFHDFVAAVEYWKQQSIEKPLRPDGKPNRPLTAYTVEMVKVKS